MHDLCMCAKGVCGGGARRNWIYLKNAPMGSRSLELSGTRGVHPSSAQSISENDWVRREVIRQWLAGLDWNVRLFVSECQSVSHVAELRTFISSYSAKKNVIFFFLTTILLHHSTVYCRWSNIYTFIFTAVGVPKISCAPFTPWSSLFTLNKLD